MPSTNYIQTNAQVTIQKNIAELKRHGFLFSKLKNREKAPLHNEIIRIKKLKTCQVYRFKTNEEGVIIINSHGIYDMVK